MRLPLRPALPRRPAVLLAGLAGVVAAGGHLLPDPAHPRTAIAAEAVPVRAVRLDVPPAPVGQARSAGREAQGAASAPATVLRGGRDLVMRVSVGARDTYESLARDYLADPRGVAFLKALNGDRLLAAGTHLDIPYAELNGTFKVRALRDLFPADQARDGDWVHRVGAGRLRAHEENLWLLALWYTGRGENFQTLAQRNALADFTPRAGQELRIPGDLLLPPFADLTARNAGGGSEAFRTDAAGEQGTADEFAEVREPPGAGAEGTHAESPSAPGTEPPFPPPVAEGAEDLTYGGDDRGRYAMYRLKAGEALYSAVVMRFTGRIDADEVNDLAAAIAARSGVRDVTDIPIGYTIRIPIEDLLPEYLPRDDPRRLEWERHESAIAREINPARSPNLADVAVILDAGHGGQDRGAAHNGVWEHDYVYDVLCRIKARLERDSGARVLTTIKDRREAYTIHDVESLRRSQAEVLLTDPPFALQGGTAGVNLRWYLTNAYFRRLLAEGYDPLKVVFISLHADARHPSLGGAMVYIPGEEYRRGRYGYSGAIYTRHREVREQRYVSFTPQERRQSEGLSRQFARSLIAAFRAHDVAVHPHGPVRERIVRRGRSWVPAVLRCSEVPVQALIEVSNLSNPPDSRLLAAPHYRQRVADALFDALHRYYGERSVPRPPVAAATGR